MSFQVASGVEYLGVLPIGIRAVIDELLPIGIRAVIDELDDPALNVVKQSLVLRETI